MRTYLILIGSVEFEEQHMEFKKYIDAKKYDWWRYTPLEWILLTPKHVSSNELLMEVQKAYGTTFITVLEININDIAGIFPFNSNEKHLLPEPDWTPFKWFQNIRDENFIPRWEREIETEYKK